MPSPPRSTPTCATCRTPTGRARPRRPPSAPSPDSATLPRTSPATHGPRSRRTSTSRSTSCSPGIAELGRQPMAGLLSGDLLVAGAVHEPPAPPPPSGSDGVCLDIVAGPEAGRSVVLSPRRYLVGRANECDITIADPTVSRRQLTIEVRRGAPPVITPEPDVANPLLLDA